MKAAIFAPITNSLYARLVTHLVTQETNVEITQIVVRNIWHWKRISGEIGRDGIRVLDKVYAKLILGENAYTTNANTIVDLAEEVQLAGRNLKDLAKKYSIPYLVTNEHNQNKVKKALENNRPDIVIFTGGGLIRKHILEIPNLGILNCHAGLLPEYRGMDVVEWAVLESKEPPPKTGLTLHFMDKGVDTGPILMKKPIPPLPDETIKDLRTRFEPEMVKLMVEGIKGLENNTLQPKRQEKEEGKQYFIMHPRLKAAANNKLSSAE